MSHNYQKAVGGQDFKCFGQSMVTFCKRFLTLEERALIIYGIIVHIYMYIILLQVVRNLSHSALGGKHGGDETYNIGI